PRLCRRTYIGCALEVLEQYGAVIIENAISPSQLNQIEREITPWFLRAHDSEGAFLGRHTKRFAALFAKAPSTIPLAIDPLIISMAEHVLGLGSRCDVIELNMSQAIGVEPGEKTQFLHREEDLWPFAHDFEVIFNVMWLLDDFTLENGGTR